MHDACPDQPLRAWDGLICEALWGLTIKAGQGDLWCFGCTGLRL